MALKLIDLELLKAFKTKLDALLGDKASKTELTEGLRAKVETTEFNPVKNTVDKLDGAVSVDGSVKKQIKDASDALVNGATLDTLKKLEDAVNGKLGSGETAVAANKLANARTIELTGGATGSASFDGSENVQINVTVGELEASKIKGVLSIDNIPASAVERVYVAENDTARLALTTEQVQNGDVVSVTDTKLMYFVVDDTKLGGDTPKEAFKEFSVGKAGSVDWNSIEGVPGYVKDYTQDIANKGDKSTVDANQKAIETLNASKETKGSVAYKIEEAKTALEQQIGNKAETSVVEALDTRVGAVETSSKKNSDDIATLKGTGEGSISKAISDKAEEINNAIIAGTTVAGKAKLADEASKVSHGLKITGVEDTFDGSKAVTISLTSAHIQNFDSAVVAVDLTENTQVKANADAIKALQTGASGVAGEIEKAVAPIRTKAEANESAITNITNGTTVVQKANHAVNADSAKKVANALTIGELVYTGEKAVTIQLATTEDLNAIFTAQA